MGAAIQGSAADNGITTGVNVTRFFPLAFAAFDNNTPEANAQITCRADGTVSKMYVRVAANSLSSATTTVTSRKSAGAGAISISITQGTTGEFSDTTNSDSLSATNTYNGQVAVAAGGSGTISFGALNAVFSATTNHAAVYGGGQAGFATPSTASSTCFFMFAGGNIFDTTEANMKMRGDVTGTLQNLQVIVTANGRSTTSTVKSRIDGADGNQTFSINSAATGLFEDTTHSDTLTAGHDFNGSFTSGTGVGTLTFQLTDILFKNTSDNKNDVFLGGRYGGGTLARTASATASFYAIIGTNVTNETTEAHVKTEHGFAGSASKMKVLVSANTYSVSATMTFRNAAADKNQTISITNAVTGLFQDSSNSDSFALADDCDYKIVGGSSGSISVQWMGLVETQVTTSIKTFDGLAYASTKTVNGLAIASVKTFDGLA